MSLLEKLRVPSGPVSLASYKTDSSPDFKGAEREGVEALNALGPTLLDLQTRLFARGHSDDHRQVLLVLQGMDTAGKGGVLVHTVGLMDPQGVKITSFKVPTPEEKAHDFLWRIEKALPATGYLGVFDRSHYEDVLIERVRSLAPADEIERRYGAINDFERDLVDNGTVVLKCMLHISPEEQKRRLLARLNDPKKYWKYNPGDLDERQLWAQYAEAYEIALTRTNTDYAPWYIVPSDHKWYRNYAVAELLVETLDSMNLDWPPASFDVAVEKARIARDTITTANPGASPHPEIA